MDKLWNGVILLLVGVFVFIAAMQFNQFLNRNTEESVDDYWQWDRYVSELFVEDEDMWWTTALVHFFDESVEATTVSGDWVYYAYRYFSPEPRIAIGRVSSDGEAQRVTSFLEEGEVNGFGVTPTGGFRFLLAERQLDDNFFYSTVDLIIVEFDRFGNILNWHELDIGWGPDEFGTVYNATFLECGSLEIHVMNFEPDNYEVIYTINPDGEIIDKAEADWDAVLGDMETRDRFGFGFMDHFEFFKDGRVAVFTWNNRASQTDVIIHTPYGLPPLVGLDVYRGEIDHQPVAIIESNHINGAMLHDGWIYFWYTAGRWDNRSIVIERVDLNGNQRRSTVIDWESDEWIRVGDVAITDEGSYMVLIWVDMFGDGVTMWLNEYDIDGYFVATHSHATFSDIWTPFRSAITYEGKVIADISGVDYSRIFIIDSEGAVMELPTDFGLLQRGPDNRFFISSWLLQEIDIYAGEWGEVILDRISDAMPSGSREYAFDRSCPFDFYFSFYIDRGWHLFGFDIGDNELSFILDWGSAWIDYESVTEHLYLGNGRIAVFYRGLSDTEIALIILDL
ncbi:MAG: hypothetical protein FWE11_10630 [Defluviitaleaceae bacterium]|nr:hypothetical protein [Defluviitaleaceae bacterium]